MDPLHYWLHAELTAASRTALQVGAPDGVQDELVAAAGGLLNRLEKSDLRNAVARSASDLALWERYREQLCRLHSALNVAMEGAIEEMAPAHIREALAAAVSLLRSSRLEEEDLCEAVARCRSGLALWERYQMA